MSGSAEHSVSSPAKRIPSLDGLRAVSISGVLLAHATTGLASGAGLHEIGERTGALGVLFFFVISGYLITMLLRREALRNGRISLVGFYRRRVLRIFPAFYSYLAVIAGLSAAGVLAISRAELAAAALHVWNYGGLWLDGTTDGGWFLGHFWTLALEEQFYLLWPLTVVAVGLNRAAAVAVAVCLTAPVLRVVCYALFPQARGLTMMMLPTGADAIMIGCVVALVEGDPRFERRIRALVSPMGAAGALAVLLLVSTPLTIALRGAYSLPLGRSIDALCVVVIVLSMIRHPACAVGRALNSRPLVHVGVLSYSLYLWQQLFLTSLNTTWSGRLPWSLACAYLAALASYLLIERPFLALKKRGKRAADAVRGEPVKDTGVVFSDERRGAAAESVTTAG